MSVNSVSQLVCACSAAWAGSLARVNKFKCFIHVGGESPQALAAGRVSGTVLSSKRAKELFNLSGSRTLMSATGLVFFL